MTQDQDDDRPAFPTRRRVRWGAVLAGTVSAAALLVGGTAQPAWAGSAPRGPAAAPAAEPCEESTVSNDPGALALQRFVAGRVRATHPEPGPATRIQMCELDFGDVVVPAHLMNHASLTLPIRGGSVSLTAVADRWDDGLPASLATPCQDDVITVHVSCTSRRLPDGSVLILDDMYDLLIYGDGAPPEKQAIRSVERVFADGRVQSIGLVYDFMPDFRESFDRFPLTLRQLAGIVLDPRLQRYFPTP